MVILSTISEFMIEVMAVGLCLGLVLRFLVYRASRYDLMFFQSFTREIEKVLVSRKRADIDAFGGPERFLHELFKSVSARLPMRSVRFGNLRNRKQRKSLLSKSEAVELQDYIHGDGSIINSLQGEMNVFTSSYKPNFAEMVQRIMARDKSWVRLFGFLPVENVSRFLAVMPALFIISGILGTFIGIAQALPEIGGINFQSFSNSNEILTGFIDKVSFAMNTSIMGIICSFIMTVLNSLVPIASVRDNIFSMVEHTLQRLWFFLHQGESDWSAVNENLIKLLNQKDQQKESHSLKGVA